MNELGKFFILLGILIIFVGIAITLVPKLPTWKLPGDILIRRDNTTIYIPIATSLIISLILTLIINILLRK